MTGLWILLGVIIFISLSVILTYNTLVQLRQNLKNAWAQIDVQLKRRHDLIPNLVETAKGYLAHEKDTLERVIKARQMAVDATNLKSRQEAENILTGTLRSLFAVMENYPNLKADQQMIRLHEELTTTENKIAFARQYYNDETARYNTTLQSFPNNVIAGMFSFTASDYFELQDPQERQAPKIQF